MVQHLMASSWLKEISKWTLVCYSDSFQAAKSYYIFFLPMRLLLPVPVASSLWGALLLRANRERYSSKENLIVAPGNGKDQGENPSIIPNYGVMFVPLVHRVQHASLYSFHPLNCFGVTNKEGHNTTRQDSSFNRRQCFSESVWLFVCQKFLLFQVPIR
jgi:hypothetical protein